MKKYGQKQLFGATSACFYAIFLLICKQIVNSSKIVSQNRNFFVI